jgi:RIO kinase 1
VPPEPAWLIRDDVDYTDTDLGRLKTGKEADVFVVERTHQNRSCLLAHKRYRPRSVTQKGELEALGFQRASAFVNDASYREGRTFAKSRDRRAAARGTKYGKRLRPERWSGREFDVMEAAWAAGVSVPYPVERRDDGLLMQFVGDAAGAALRLAQARLTAAETADAFAQLVTNLRALVGAGFVHADLSAYNVLWWQGAVWLIDFPQAVDIGAHPGAFDFLQRDIANLCTWFGRQGVDADPQDLFAELVALA